MVTSSESLETFSEVLRLRAEVQRLQDRVMCLEGRKLTSPKELDTPSHIFNSLPLLAFCVGRNLTLRMANQQFEALFPAAGTSKHELTLHDVMPPESAATFKELFEEVHTTGLPLRKEVTLGGAGGVRYDITVLPRGVGCAGRSCAALVIGIDVSDASYARDALDRVNRLMYALLDASPISAFLMDRDGTVLAQNQMASTVMAVPGQSRVGNSAYAMLPQSLQISRRREVEACMRSGARHVFEDRQDDRIYRHSIVPVEDADGVGRMALYAMDVTEERQQEESLRLLLQTQEQQAVANKRALQEHTEQVRQIFDEVPLGIVHIGLDGNIVNANRVFAALCGVPVGALLGTLARDLVHPDDVQDVRQGFLNCLAEQEGIFRDELRMRHADGTWRHVEVTGSVLRPLDDKPATVLAVVQDVTEVRRLRAEAMRSGQLAALGELAAGVAHEINNPVNGIINCAQLLLDTDIAAQNDMAEIHDTADRIRSEGERIAAIVRNLLFLARDRQQDSAPVDLVAVLEASLALVRSQLAGDHIVVDYQCQGMQLHTYGRSRELQQVFLNVLSNARYALNLRYPMAHPDKWLRISCANIPGKARLVFEDNGPGAPEQVVARAFEPFFSTKPEGKGTGLGLSISYGIIEAHEGRLGFEPREGGGMRVTVELPAGGDS